MTADVLLQFLFFRDYNCYLVTSICSKILANVSGLNDRLYKFIIWKTSKHLQAAVSVAMQPARHVCILVAY